jgi:hypothetical protein
MTHRTITSIDGGSAEYWRQRTVGFRLIREAEDCAKRLETAPLYLHGGYDTDGDVIPVENLGPHDDMEDVVREIEANETAVSILVAQRRTHIGRHPIPAVIRRLNPPDEDPESNPLWGPNTD